MLVSYYHAEATLPLILLVYPIIELTRPLTAALASSHSSHPLCPPTDATHTSQDGLGRRPPSQRLGSRRPACGDAGVTNAGSIEVVQLRWTV